MKVSTLNKPVNCTICQDALNQDYDICEDVSNGPTYHQECLLALVERKQTDQQEMASLLSQLETRMETAEKAVDELTQLKKRLDKLETRPVERVEWTRLQGLLGTLNVTSLTQISDFIFMCSAALALLIFVVAFLIRMLKL